MRKVMFTGSRKIPMMRSSEIIENILSKYSPRETVVIVGDAAGVDEAVQYIAKHLGFTVLVGYANWKYFRGGGGVVRNSAMVEITDEGYAIWDGKSTGTLDGINKLKKAGKLKQVIEIRE